MRTIDVTETREAAAAGEGPPARRWLLFDTVSLAALAALAVWLRADRLMTVPAFTDESMEVLLALDMRAAGRLNLVGVSSFLGGLHTWLLMAVVALPGAGAEGPRVLSLVAGLATVLLTYALGRTLGGRWAGLLAGGLLATNLAHVAINSRIAWSNCVTPLFMTAGLLLLTRALANDRPRWLPAAGLAIGLGVQTHPSAVALLPGVAVGVLLTAAGRRALRTPWPWLGGVAAALAYANVLWFNLMTGGRSLAAAQEREYAVHPAASLDEYLTNLSGLLLQLARNAGSVFEPGSPTPAYPVTATMLGTLALAGVGLAVAARRGWWLLPSVLLTSVLLMPLIGGEYQPPPHGSSRYLGSLWPVLAALAGLGVVMLAQLLSVSNGTPRPGTAPQPPNPGGLEVVGHRPGPARAAVHKPPRIGGLGGHATTRRAGPIALGVVGLLLVLSPAQTTRAYLDWYGGQPFVGDFNAFALATARAASVYAPGGRVYLDTSLHGDESSDAGTMHRSLTMLLRLEGGLPVTLPRQRRQTLPAVWEALGGLPGLAVLRRDHARSLTAEGGRLSPLGAATRVVDPAIGEVRLYVLERA